MEYTDTITVDGHAYRLTARSAADRCQITLTAAEPAADPVQVTGTIPLAALAPVGTVIQRALSGLAQLTGYAQPPHPASQRFKDRVAADRSRHPRAWTPWREEDDAYLRTQHAAGADVHQLADDLGRKPAAIISRLDRLGLTIPTQPTAPDQPATPDQPTAPHQPAAPDQPAPPVQDTPEPRTGADNQTSSPPDGRAELTTAEEPVPGFGDDEEPPPIQPPRQPIVLDWLPAAPGTGHRPERPAAGAGS